MTSPLRTRVVALGATLLAVTLGIAALPSAALAEPGGQPVTRCSAWKINGMFQDKVCVTMDPSSSSIRHDHYVDYFGAGTGKASASSNYYINSAHGPCRSTGYDSYSSGQVRTYTCWTTRVTGYVYKTDGSIKPYNGNSGAYVVSPTVTG